MAVFIPIQSSMVHSPLLKILLSIKIEFLHALLQNNYCTNIFFKNSQNAVSYPNIWGACKKIILITNVNNFCWVVLERLELYN